MYPGWRRMERDRACLDDGCFSIYIISDNRYLVVT